MSKKVTAVSKPVNVNGTYLCLASDGTIRGCNTDTKNGEDLDGFDIALHRDNVKAVLKAAPIMAQIVEIEKKLDAIKAGPEGAYGQLKFEDEEGEIAITVGCTSVCPEELPGYLKALGLKR